MTDYADFFPLFGRSEAQIRASFDASANAGMTPDDPDWVDTRPGSPFWIATQPAVVHIAATYARMNESVAAALLPTSWDTYLDLIAEGYGEQRKQAVKAVGEITFEGDNGTLVGTGVRMSPPQTDPDVDPPIFETTASGTISGGEVTLAIRALNEGSDGNVAAASITLLQSGVDGVASISNAAATYGGADEEGDDELKERLSLLFKGKGSGTIADYARWTLGRPGVGRVRIVPAWAGVGTVKVIIMTAEGDPVGPEILADVQEFLDPVEGQGEGQAPINHDVTVTTPDTVVLNVSADVQFLDGYSLDGAGGTIALQDALAANVKSYIDSLTAGQSIVANHVLAQFFRIQGVQDVSNLKIDTADPPVATGDFAIDDDHVAQSNKVELTAV